MKTKSCGKPIMVSKESSGVIGMRPQFINYSIEVPNPGISEEKKIGIAESNIVFPSKMLNDPPKYGNTYTFAGQGNISMTPSTVTNLTPSSIGMKIDSSFQPYGPYIFPMQGFPGYPALYPSVVPLHHFPNPPEVMKLSTSVQHDQINAPTTTSSEVKTLENSNGKTIIVNKEVFKENEERQSVPVIVTKDNINTNIENRCVKNVSTITSDFTTVIPKTMPSKVDKQTGPSANSYVKPIKTQEMPLTSTNTAVITTMTNPINTNNGAFTLKTSIPISKIDMKSIPPPIDNNALRNKPSVELNESKVNEVQPIMTTTPSREQNKQLVDPLKNDLKQNFFHQGNAVVHPHNIIKMLVPSQSIDSQCHTDTNNRSKPHIISDILLKPVDVLHKPNENNIDNFTTNSLNIPISVNNCNVRNEVEKFNIRTETKTNPESLQTDANKDVKKQYVFIPNPHVANKLLLSISSKQASNPILLPKPSEDGKINSQFAVPQIPEKYRETGKGPETLLDPNNKVVSLKRLHHENYDENDFENLITENQIYGNKIVIKEKSQPVFIHPANVHQKQSKAVKNEMSPPKDTVNQKANIVVQPNFLYVSNVKFQPNSPNLMVLNNNTLNSQQIANEQINHKPVELKTDASIQATSQNKVMFGTQTFRTVNPVTHTVSYVKTENNNVDVTKPGTVLQTLLSKPNIKVSEPNQATKIGGQKVIGQLMNNKIVYQVPMIIDRNNVTNRAVNVVKPTYLNSELAMLLTKSKNEQKDSITNINTTSDGKYNIMKSNDVIVQTFDDNNSKIVLEEVSALDLAEKRKAIRDKRKLLLSNKSESDDEASGWKEKEKYLSSQHYYYDEESDESDVSDEEDAVSNVKKQNKLPLEAGEGKLEFLSAFGLTTKSVKKEKELDKLERSLRMDLVVSANVAARAKKICKQMKKIHTVKYGEQPLCLPIPMITENPINNETKEKITDKIVFMNELKLGMVPHSYKIEHEMMWQYALKDRKKRNGHSSLTDYMEKTFKAQNFSNFINNNNVPIDVHTRDQLEIMTKIKQSVLENNNLIKQKLDKLNQTNEPDNDISYLAEKNFTEIQKLSYMANKSLTILKVSQDAIPQANKQSSQFFNVTELQQVPLAFPTHNNEIFGEGSHLIIPKIVSLKSTEVQCTNVDISPATSMDEPRCSAGGVSRIGFTDTLKGDPTKPVLITRSTETCFDDMTDTGPQIKQSYSWPGIFAVLESYRSYSKEGDKERQRIIERDEVLKNEISLKENDATCLGAHLRLLLAEQQICEEQRQTLQRNIDALANCITQILA